MSTEKGVRAKEWCINLSRAIGWLLGRAKASLFLSAPLSERYEAAG